MVIKTLKLMNFGKFNDYQIEFGKNINFIIGENGSGKTTIVDAVYFVLFGIYKNTNKRRRKREDFDRYGSYLNVELIVEKEGVEYLLSRIYEDGKEKNNWNSSSEISNPIDKNRLNLGAYGEFLYGLNRTQFVKLSLYREDGIWLDEETKEKYERFLMDLFGNQVYNILLTSIEKDLDAIDNIRKKDNVIKQKNELEILNKQIIAMRNERDKFSYVYLKAKSYVKIEEYFNKWSNERIDRKRNIEERKIDLKNLYSNKYKLEDSLKKLKDDLYLKDIMDTKIKSINEEIRSINKIDREVFIFIIFIVCVGSVLFINFIKYKMLIILILSSLLGILIFKNINCKKKKRRILEEKAKEISKEINNKFSDNRKSEKEIVESIKKINDKINFEKNEINICEEEIFNNDSEYNKFTEENFINYKNYKQLLELEYKISKLEKIYNYKKIKYNDLLEQKEVIQYTNKFIKSLYLKDKNKWLPSKLEHLNVIINHISRGKYVRIIVSDKGVFSLCSSKDEKIPEYKMSFGEKKILHLALRLELLFSFGDENIPIFMDDIVANFDSVNKSAIIEGFFSLCKNRQLFFTINDIEIARKYKLDIKKVIL